MPYNLRSSASRDGSTEPQDRNENTAAVMDERTGGSQDSGRTPNSNLEDVIRTQGEQLDQLRQMFEQVLSKISPRGEAYSATQVGSHGERSTGDRGSAGGTRRGNTSERGGLSHQDNSTRHEFVSASSGSSTTSVRSRHKVADSLLDQYGPESGDTCRSDRPLIINQIEPPIFNGDRSKARSWLKRYEDVMNVNGYGDHQKLLRARAYLSGEASQWYTKALTIKPDADWYGLKSLFLRDFCGMDSYQFLRRRLDEARQKPNEHPSTYLSRVVDICREFNPNMSEDEMLKKLANGMNQSTYNSLVMHRRYVSWTLEWLDEMFAELKFSSFDKTSREGHKDTDSRNRKPLKSEKPTWACWNCGDKGHGVTSCEKPLDATRVEASRQAAIKAKKLKSRPNSENSDATAREVNALSAEKPAKSAVTAVLACDTITKPTLELRLNDKSYTGRIDSGADITAIPASIAEELQLPLIPWKLAPLRAVGSKLLPRGMASVIVSYGLATRSLIVAVIPDQQLRQPLWALDIIQGFKLTIDYKSGELELGNVAGASQLSINNLDTQAHPIDKVQFGNVTDCERNSISKVLTDYADVFSRDELDIGRTGTIKHRIHLTDDAPVHKAFYRVPVRNRDRMEETINRMLKMGVIRESKSPYAAPVFFVDKDQGRDKRLVADYRALNDKTVPDRTPMPHPDDVFGLLGGTCLYAKLDITSMFNQIEVDERDIEKTAIITPFGLFEYVLTPFGLMNAPATAVRLMRSVLRGLDGKTCFVYFDDIIIYASSFEELTQRCAEVLDRLRSHGLKLKPTKCSFAVDSVKFLGHVISARGIEMDPSRTIDVQKFPTPKNPTHVRSFYGICSYNRKFIKDFASIAKPLHPLMGKPSEFVWTPEAQQAFEKLRDALVSAPILVKYDPDAEHELRTDASSHAIGAVLYQKHQDPRGTGVVLYFSKTLTPTQSRYSATERELLAAFVAITELQHYLVGKKFTLVTDHEALSLIRNYKNDPHNRLARWVAQLQSFEFDVKYKKGTKHQDADCMSRLVRQDCPQVDDNADIRDIGNLESEDQDQDLDPRGQNVNVHEVVPELPNVRQKQREDPFCKKYLDILESTELSDAEKASTTKYFSIQDDLLYRIEKDGAPTLVVPEVHQRAVLEACHDSPLAGHLGFDRTWSTVKKRFFWHRMRKQVKQYVASCHICQCRKAPNRRKQGLTMPLPIAEDVFDTVGIDLITKLPRSNGYNTILVCTDNLSKYVVTVPLRDEKADSIIHAFFNHVVAKHGCPRVVISDRGSNLIGESSRDFFRYFGIIRQLTTPYHPQSNGQTERFNRTLAASLTAHVFKHQENWSDYLQAATFAYNTSVHSVTRVPPYIAVFGREPRLPIENVLERSEFIDPTRPPPGQLSTEAVRKMKEYVLKNQAQNKARLDARLAECTFEPGDLVIVKRTERKRNNAEKFSLRYIGPYRIHSKVNDLLYKIDYLGGRPGLHTVHSWDLKHYTQRVGNVADEIVAPSFVPMAPRDLDEESVSTARADSPTRDATFESPQSPDPREVVPSSDSQVLDFPIHDLTESPRSPSPAKETAVAASRESSPPIPTQQVEVTERSAPHASLFDLYGPPVLERQRLSDEDDDTSESGEI